MNHDQPNMHFEALRTLADGGDRAAMQELYTNYLDYQLGPEKQAVAASWLEKAAHLDDSKAQYILATLYETGDGQDKDEKLAAYWYGKAARNGHNQAQFCLGYCYEHGIGLDPDHKLAAHWYDKAAGQGMAEAQNNLGVLYQNGKGVLQNEQKAKSLFHSADQGDRLKPVWNSWMGPSLRDKLSSRCSK